MAFGDALRSDGATVTLTANTGEFNAKIDAAQRNWEQSVGQMSREALKFDLAQQRLNTSLAKTGATSASTKRATIALKDAQEQAYRATTRTSGAYTQTERSLGRLTRGAVAGSGIFRGLGRSLAFASAAFLGGTGLVYAIRTSISAAIEQDKILANLRNSLQASGISWKQYGQEITDATQKTKALSAFDDEDLYQSLQLLIRGTGDVNKALKLNALAADVARARNMGLVQAATLLVRVNAGSVGSLRRLGIIVDKTASGTEALAQVQRKYAGAAQAFGNSAAGASARFSVGLHDVEKAIGRGILPQFTELTNKAADWLNQSENQARVQRDVTEAMQSGEKVVKGLAAGFGTLRDILKPVVDGLGGVEQAAKDFAIAFAVYKLTKIAAGVKGIAAAFNLIGPAAERNAAVAVAAENRIGAAGIANAGRVGILGRAVGGLAAGGFGGPLTVGLIATSFVAPWAQQRDARHNAQIAAKLLAAARAGQLTAADAQQIMSLPSWALSDSEKRAIVRAINAHGVQEPGEGNLGGPPPSVSGGTTGHAYQPGERDFALAVARAQATPGTADDVRALQAQRGFYQKQINALEALQQEGKRLSKKQKDKLAQLYSDRNSAQSQLEAIASANEQKIKEARAKAAERRRKALQAHRQQLGAEEQRLENALLRAGGTAGTADDRKASADLIAFYRRASHDADLTDKERAAYENKRLKVRDKLRAARVAGEHKRLDLREQRLNNAVDRAELTKTLDDDRKTLKALIAFYRAEAHDQDLTEKERLAAEKKRIAARKRLLGLSGGKSTPFDAIGFLQSLTGVIGQFGSNYDDNGAMLAHAQQQTHTGHKTLQELRKLAAGQWHPDTSYYRGELSAAGYGTGF